MRRVVSRDEALQHVRGAGRDLQGRDRPVDPGERGDLAFPARRLHRSLPRPARGADRRDQGLQGALVRRRLLARATSATRCSSGSTAPPSRRRRSWTSTSTRLEEAKARDHRVARQATRPLLVRRPGGPRLRALAPQGRVRPLPDRGSGAAGERAPRVPAGLHAAPGARAAAGHIRAPGPLPGEPVRRHGAGGAALPGQADELPLPRGHLPVAAALVPRPAASATRSWGPSTATNVRACCTACCACAA